MGWQEDLLTLGRASLTPDCFSARGIERSVEDQGVLPQLAMAVDAFHALDLLRRDRLLAGWSGGHGGGTTETAASGGPAGAGLRRGHLERDGAPVLVLQGDNDDDVGVEQLQRYNAELETVAAPLALCWLRGAGPVFDGPADAPAVRRPLAQTLLAAQIVEGDQGVLLNSITGRPFSWRDPQVGRGATVADDPAAHAESRKQVWRRFWGERWHERAGQPIPLPGRLRF